MSPSLSPATLHDAYEWWRDIWLPLAGTIATLFVGGVAVWASLYLGRRTERQAAHKARVSFAAELESWVRWQIQKSPRRSEAEVSLADLRKSAQALSDPNAEWLVNYVDAEVWILQMTRASYPSNDPRRYGLPSEALQLVRAWAEHPGRASSLIRARQKAQDESLNSTDENSEENTSDG